ncbi:MAG: AAA family ATPase [Firmicutes bacterium]|nr:AAA family ATPase [Bacillota bacterium]
MIYVNSFTISKETVRNPNIYPYHVFAGRDLAPFYFNPITVFYGDNGSGKSTLLNLMAIRLHITGAERYAYGQKYIDQFAGECIYTMAEDEQGRACQIPKISRYIKSEDILFEIKKIQQEEALQRGYVYEMMEWGQTRQEAENGFYGAVGLETRNDIIQFAQEKYSNGETTMDIMTEWIQPDGLYLLDEPEVSLSPQNQVALSVQLNQMARYLNCQFIVATHSPFMLATMDGIIYNLDEKEGRQTDWWELPNVRYFYDFFKQHKGVFEKGCSSLDSK